MNRINTRQQGKAWERFFVHRLNDIFPNIRRNAGTQSQSGGVDLENTKPFNFEVKGGKQCRIKKTRGWLEQIKSEGIATSWDAVLVKPSREEGFVLMPFEDFKEILWLLKREGLI